MVNAKHQTGAKQEHNKMNTYEVEISRCPVVITVQAKSIEEAKVLAKKQVDFVVWESRVWKVRA
jgi:hypothetical protein